VPAFLRFFTYSSQLSFPNRPLNVKLYKAGKVNGLGKKQATLPAVDSNLGKPGWGNPARVLTMTMGFALGEEV
jgi:hypothetical protein